MMIIDKELTDLMIQEAKERRFLPSEGMYRKKLIKHVMKVMEWDRPKSVLWFSMENPNFGNVSPDVLIKMGRGYKVETFIKCAEQENNGE